MEIVTLLAHASGHDRMLEGGLRLIPRRLVPLVHLIEDDRPRDADRVGSRRILRSSREEWKGPVKLYFESRD